MNPTRIGVIRIRGPINVKKDVEKTLKLLHLYRKNNCVIIKNNPNYVGMLKKVQYYVTWGEIDEETLKKLLEKRGRLMGKKKLTEEYVKDKIKIDLNTFVKEFMDGKKELLEIPGMKPFFRLNPPVHGFERKGIKKPYSLGGVLGYRKEKINDLLRRML